LSKLQIIIYYNAFLKIWTHAALATGTPRQCSA
jgi:hypothetical protein